MSAEARQLPMERSGSETWDRVIDDCFEQFEAASSAEEKSRLLLRIGEVFRVELKDEEQAFEAVLEAFRLDPSHEEAVAEIAALARSLRRWPHVIDALRGFVESEPDGRRRLQLCEHGARWCKEAKAELGADAADPFVVEIDRIDPSHWAVRRRLASIYSEQGIWDLRREELERALLRADTDEKVRDTRFALGELHELRLDDLRRATVHYEAALACAPRSKDVLRALARVFEKRELHDRARDTLVVVLALTTDPIERHPLLVRLATVWDRHFLKPANAVPLLEEALEIAPKDAEAFDLLEHCYRAMRAWPDYARTLERRLELLATDAERAAGLVRIGRVFDSALHDAARAQRAYRRACGLDPRHEDALTELARLAERSDDWRSAAHCREKLAALCTSPRERARLHIAIGALLEPPNRDPDRARAQYECAAEMDPGLSAAWEGLQRLAEQEGAYASAARFLAERIGRTEGQRAKARLLCELGVLWERTGSSAKAIEAYEAARTALPESAAVAHDLLRLYRDANRELKAARLCPPLLRAALADGDSARVVEILRTAAHVATSLEESAEMLAIGTRAVARFPGAREVVAALVDLGYALRERPDAADALRDAVEAATEDASGLPATTLVKLGQTVWALGETDRGVDFLVAALGVDETCLPALQDLVEHFGACGDWERASSYRLWLARATPDPQARFTMLVDAATELFDANDLEQAAWVYEEARPLRPGYRVLLDRLVSIYTALEDWARLLDVQRALADSEDLPALRAARVRSMGVVAWTKQKDGARALALFEEALDLDPTRLDALEAFATIAKQTNRLRELARVHAWLLVRSEDATDGARESLAPGSLRASDAAIGSVRPPRTESSAIVPIDVMERSGTRLEHVRRLKHLRERVAAAPLSASTYRELAAALRATSAADAAWCAGSVLRHLGGADPEADRFASAFVTPDLRAASGALAEADWYGGLFHPEIDRPLLAALSLASVALRGRAKSEPALPSGEPVSERTPGKGARLATLIRDVARVLRLPEPRVYERPAATEAICVASAPTPEVHVSFAAIDALPAGSLPFVAGRALAALHPVLAVHAERRTAAQLRDLFAIAAKVVDPEATIGDEEAATLREALTEDEHRALAAAVTVIGDRATPPDFERLSELIAISALRAGLLVQGAVDRAWAVILRESGQSCELPSLELRQELLTFAVGPEHTTLRERTGLAVRPARGPDEHSAGRASRLGHG
jgi:tetratricopeptide (TPR) repeat protein